MRCDFPACTELLAQLALLRVVCACAHAYHLLRTILMLLLQRCRGELLLFFFFCLLNVPFIYLLKISAFCCLCIEATVCAFIFLSFPFRLLCRSCNATCMQKGVAYVGVQKLFAIALANGWLVRVVSFSSTFVCVVGSPIWTSHLRARTLATRLYAMSGVYVDVLYSCAPN